MFEYVDLPVLRYQHAKLNKNKTKKFKKETANITILINHNF